MQGSWYQDAAPNYTKNCKEHTYVILSKYLHIPTSSWILQQFHQLQASGDQPKFNMHTFNDEQGMDAHKQDATFVVTFSKTTCTCRYDEYFINLYVVKKGSRCCRKSKVTDTLHYLSISVFVLLWLFLLSMHSYQFVTNIDKNANV